MSNFKTVWIDGQGDVRKEKSAAPLSADDIDWANLEIKIRRLTSGKGRTVVELSDLPNNKNWCKSLAKSLKKKLGVGGTYKNNLIEVHGEKLNQVTALLDEKSIKWKKTGG